MLKTITYTEIIEKFKNGERDFSGIRLVGGNFERLDLRGIIFRKSILIGPTFFWTNLTDADFSDTKLEFCSFFSGNLKNAKFQNAKIETTSFQEANLENTNFDGSEIYWCVFIDSNYSASNVKKAKIIKALFAWSELTESDIEEAIRLFGTKVKDLPRGRALQLTGAVESAKEIVNSLRFAYGKGLEQSKSGYSLTSKFYVKPTLVDTYSSQLKDIVYNLFGGYGVKRSKDREYK